MAQRADIARARKDQAAKNLQADYRETKKQAAARMEAAMAEASDSDANPQGGAAAAQRLTRASELAQAAWRATLGAAVTARHRGGKLFARLVEKGARYQHLRSQSRQAYQEVIQEQEKPTAAERIHNLEHRLEESLDKGRDNTLHWIGVPSWKEFEALEDQVLQLQREIHNLQQQLSGSASVSDVPKHL